MINIDFKKIFIVLVFLFFLVNSCPARIIHVPPDSSTIQAGINGAEDNDTVLVAPGTYYENINFLGKSILVTSNFIFDSDTNTILLTIIDGSHPINPKYGSVVIFDSGEDSLSILKGFTLQNGSATHMEESTFGGGILCTSSPSILNNRIFGNYAHFGAGICARGEICSPKIASNVVIQNTGIVGAGIFGEFSQPQIVENLIQGNYASYRGGGIFCKLAQPTIIGNKVFKNESVVRGGGINVAYSYVQIMNNHIAFNQTGEDGGGIYLAGNYSVLVYRNLIHQNQAQKGGGIFVTDCSSQIVNNTVNDNFAEEAGGVYYQGTDYTEIIDNIITNSSQGGGLLTEPGSNFHISYNDVWNNIGGNFRGCYAGIGDTSWGLNHNNTPCDSSYNIIQDPLFVNLGINFHLNCLSPCRDAGAPYLEVPPGGGEIVDMGVFEYLPISGDINGDEKINTQDIFFLIDFLFRSQPPFCAYDAGDVNCDHNVNISDLVYLINFMFKGGPPPCPGEG